MKAGNADAVDPDAIENAIFDLLAARRPDATICPSEVARRLTPDTDDWRLEMQPVREVAQRLADAGRLVVTRAGLPVSALGGGGPIRLGLPKD